jgi:hypothetical protein
MSNEQTSVDFDLVLAPLAEHFPKPVYFEGLNQELGELVVVAIMRSASTDVIRPVDWWGRARSALDSACSRADDFPAFVAEMARKLNIHVFAQLSAQELIALEQRLDFKAWRQYCASRAVYVIAGAQNRNTKAREASKAKTKTKTKAKTIRYSTAAKTKANPNPNPNQGTIF